jgi:hypothetical protein
MIILHNNTRIVTLSVMTYRLVHAISDDLPIGTCERRLSIARAECERVKNHVVLLLRPSSLPLARSPYMHEKVDKIHMPMRIITAQNLTVVVRSIKTSEAQGLGVCTLNMGWVQGCGCVITYVSQGIPVYRLHTQVCMWVCPIFRIPAVPIGMEGTSKGAQFPTGRT